MSSSGWDVVAQVMGWSAFALWSISFYPQAFTNWRRKSVVGLSFDLMLYNLMGFSFLAVYNAFMLWDPTTREQYSDRNNGGTPQVAENDFAFAAHATTLMTVYFVQVAIFDRGNQKFSWLAITIFGSLLLAALIYSAIVLAGAAEILDLVYYLSYVKLSLTFIKYCPQVIMNWQRQSTVGFNISNAILDFLGSWLSLGQLFIDCWQDDDWSGVTGNPVKLFLSLFSIFFTMVFMVQHYILYPHRQARDDQDETTMLIPKESSIQDTKDDDQKRSISEQLTYWAVRFAAQTSQ